MQIYAASLALAASLVASVSAQTNGSAPAAAAAAPAAPATNFTYQAKWPANIKALTSEAYVQPKFDLSILPKFQWSLLNESLSLRQSVCAQQMSFCDKAGCDADKGVKPEDAKVHDNWCDPTTMAVKCTCAGGTSRLQQYQWPVQTADCRGRGAACENMCKYGGGATNGMSTCVDNCAKTFGMNCGLQGQMSASYAVMSKGEKPALTMQQGGVSQSPAALNAQTASMAVVASVAVLATVAGSLL